MELEPATPEDAAWAANAVTLIHPDEPEDPDIWVARATEVHEGVEQERWNLLEDGERVGQITVFMIQADNELGFADIEVFLAQGRRTPERAAEALELVEQRARHHGARIAQVWTREDDAFEIGALVAGGYRLDRLSKAWELDLAVEGPRLLEMRERTRALARELGVTFATLAERQSEAELREIHRVNAEAEQDIPHTGPEFVRPFDAWRTWTGRSDIRHDRYWTAWQGDRCVALSFLKYPEIGNVWTGFTGSAREVRGTGLARAVKMETVGQAIELGVKRIRTDNDSENAPMLHINEGLGYRPIPGYPSYIKQIG